MELFMPYCGFRYYETYLTIKHLSTDVIALSVMLMLFSDYLLVFYYTSFNAWFW